VRSAGVRRTLVVVIAVPVAVLVVVLGWVLYDPGSGGNPTGRLTNQTNTGPYSASTAPTSSSAGTSSPTSSDDGLATVSVDDLPPEAGDTLALIAAGGPFPYDQDGITFENREGLLPAHDSGYYREYTVVTPGSPDRGARRIVVGSAGEQYYTADHYVSFARIVP
jgi:ribonuclease T1